MILLRACPRCSGDLIREELLGEAELACLQCGYRLAADVRRAAAVPVGKAA